MNFFRKILKNRKFQKVTFSEKVDFFEKSKFFELFSKKLTFLKMLSFSTKIEKHDFLKFSIFQNRLKNIFHRKIIVFGKVSLFIFVSYLMYYLIEWHRGTPTVPPVGAVNVPDENPKIQKIHIFEDFLEHFFLIKHIGFSLKYVIPKSSTDFFSSKTKSFSKNFHFFIFYHISSPISESFIAQLLQHRGLN